MDFNRTCERHHSQAAKFGVHISAVRRRGSCRAPLLLIWTIWSDSACYLRTIIYAILICSTYLPMIHLFELGLRDNRKKRLKSSGICHGRPPLAPIVRFFACAAINTRRPGVAMSECCQHGDGDSDPRLAQESPADIRGLRGRCPKT